MCLAENAHHFRPEELSGVFDPQLLIKAVMYEKLVEPVTAITNPLI